MYKCVLLLYCVSIISLIFEFSLVLLYIVAQQGGNKDGSLAFFLKLLFWKILINALKFDSYCHIKSTPKFCSPHKANKILVWNFQILDNFCTVYQVCLLLIVRLNMLLRLKSKLTKINIYASNVVENAKCFKLRSPHRCSYKLTYKFNCFGF